MNKKHNCNASQGVIYILTNPSFPEYVKIGYATDLQQRLKQLNKSEAIPYAFRAYAIYEVDGSLTDKDLHYLIDKLNPDLRSIETFAGKKRVKEFYAMSAEDAFELLQCIAKISGTEQRLKHVTATGQEKKDEEEAKVHRQEAKRGPFRFSAAGIPFGSELAFIKDPSVKVTVVDDRHVRYDTEVTSVSALTQKLLKLKHPVQGTIFFTYNGKLLDDIRQQAEKTEKK